MPAITPRVVFVIRDTDYELLIARHATRGQVRFFLESRGQTLAEVEARHAQFQAVLAEARSAVPLDWRQALVRRPDLDRFLFAPDHATRVAMSPCRAHVLPWTRFMQRSWILSIRCSKAARYLHMGSYSTFQNSA